MCEMRIEILDCLKRERYIYVKNVIPSQNTAFMWIPALRESLPAATIINRVSNLGQKWVRKIADLGHKKGKGYTPPPNGKRTTNPLNFSGNSPVGDQHTDNNIWSSHVKEMLI